MLPFLGFSQCPGGFSSQAQIHAFATNFPDCTILDGSLIISGDDITDLSGISQITACRSLSISKNLVLETTAGLNANLVLYYVEGAGNSFSISNNASLLEIAGLENLVNQSGFESYFSIRDNPLLVSLQGLPNDFNALSYFYLIINDSLTNLDGLGNISGCELSEISNNDGLLDLMGMGNFYAEYLKISNNSSLQSLNGSESASFDDYLIIEYNQNLTDISAIYAGSYSDDGLIIRNNPNLSICSTAPVCFFLESNGIEEGIWLPGILKIMHQDVIPILKLNMAVAL